MAALTDKELYEIYELQKKLFTTSTENNPYLKNNPVNPDLNKGLNTESKTIIGAINDIFAITTAVRDTNADFIDRFNRIIGNEELNPSLVKKLSEIGSNFYDALFKSWDLAKDSYEKAEKFEGELKNLKSQLESLIEEGLDGTGIVKTYSYEETFYTGNIFTISHTPITDSITVHINGILYNKGCFTLSNDNKTFTWNEDAFEITEESDEVIVRYNSYEN